MLGYELFIAESMPFDVFISIGKKNLSKNPKKKKKKREKQKKKRTKE